MWSFITCCLHGDDKLHVNVFVPSGSDESDCTPGILFVCESECVCVLSMYHSGNGGTPAIAVILIKVLCVTRSECVSECVCVLMCVFLCMLCLITEDGVVDSLL